MSMYLCALYELTFDLNILNTIYIRSTKGLFMCVFITGGRSLGAVSRKNGWDHTCSNPGQKPCPDWTAAKGVSSYQEHPLTQPHPGLICTHQDPGTPSHSTPPWTHLHSNKIHWSPCLCCKQPKDAIRFSRPISFLTKGFGSWSLSNLRRFLWWITEAMLGWKNMLCHNSADCSQMYWLSSLPHIGN